MRTRVWRGIGAGLAAGLVATAVSSAALAKTSITVAMWLEGQSLKETKQLIDDYSKKHGIDVKLMATPWGGYLDKILALASAGKVPDVIVAERRFLPLMAKNGLLRTLDDVVKAEGFDAKSQLSMWRSAYYDGHFYGFPIEGGPHVIEYNPALFDKSGVQSPNSYMQANQWTWDTFVDVGQKLTHDTNGDGQPDIFGLAAVFNVYADWCAKIRQNGGDVVDEGYTKALIDSPDAIGGITFWRDLALKYNIAPKPSQGGMANFGSGKAAMSMDWATLAPLDKDATKGKVDIQIALQPAGKAGYAALAGANPIAVAKSTKHFKEAYAFAKWFAMESDFWKIIGAPASKAVFKADYEKYLGTYFKNPEVLNIGLEFGRPEPVIHPRFQLLEDSMMPVMAKVIAGRLSPAEAAKLMSDGLNRVLKMK